MYTAPQRRAGVGALFRVHKNGTEPGPRPDLRTEMPIQFALQWQVASVAVTLASNPGKAASATRARDCC